MTPEKWLQQTDAPSFRRRLLRWYARHGRDFAWRRSTDLYAVWVSEVMLQQTTTATVGRRFPQFLAQFPTLQALAGTPEQTVLRAWEGLGYYRRARNLHRAARIVMDEHAGEIPTDPAVLRSLPGLGRYSANAILSFARNARLPILEANTLRVWSRLCGVRGDPTKQPFSGGLWTVAEAMIPSRRGRDFNLAMMDLGSLICTPRGPDCPRCPVRNDCVAFRSGQPERFPLKAAAPATVDERHVVVVVRRRGRVLIQKRSDEGRWAGMWEFPQVRLAAGEDSPAVAVDLAGQFGEIRGTAVTLPPICHGIMHYRVTLECFSFESSTSSAVALREPNRRWVTLRALAELPLSVAHRKIVTAVAALRVGKTRKATGAT